jgi:hypothetical protein
MKPVAAAVAGALIGGVAVYTVWARTPNVNAYAEMPAFVQDGQLGGASQGYASGFQPVAQPAVWSAPRPAPVAAPAAQPVRSAPAVVQAERAEPDRSWQKSALIIGGSAASGAAVGGVIKGKKGALIGAAAGGGAASIYEATRRR